MGQRMERVKTHVKENKKIYLACGGTAVVAATVAAVGTMIVVKRKAPSVEATNQIIAAVAWKPRQELNQYVIELVERSTPSKAVHLVGTDRYFSSLHEAARETGHSVTKISRQVNGHIPDLNGDVFELLEPAA